MSQSRKILRKSALALTSLLVVLVVAELIVRQFAENPITGIERTRPGWKAHGLQADDELGYAFEPGVSSRMVLPGNFDVAFRINEQGIRDDVVYGPEHPGVVRILLIGDSQVFGVGVELQDTLGKALERYLLEDPAWDRPTEVVAVGCPSYGFDNYAKLIERWKPLVRPDLVLLGLYPGNDLIDYEKKAASPSVVIEGFIVSRHMAWSYELRRFSTLAHLMLKHLNPYPQHTILRPARPSLAGNRQLFETMEPWIDRAVAACGPEGPALAVTILIGETWVAALRQGNADFATPPTANVLAAFVNRGATLLDPRPAWAAADAPAEEYFHPTDWHYNPRGSHLVARALAESIRKEFGDVLTVP